MDQNLNEEFEPKKSVSKVTDDKTQINTNNITKILVKNLTKNVKTEGGLIIVHFILKLSMSTHLLNFLLKIISYRI